MSCSVVGAGVAHSASAIVAMAVNGSHVLKIDGYSQTKRLGNGKSIKYPSPSTSEAIPGVSGTTLMVKPKRALVG